MAKGKSYEFHTGAKVAIFTYHGCHLVVRGATDVIYVAKETPMVQYLNVHTGLEQMRAHAEELGPTRGGSGPIVMVVGPTDVGKSTVCRILLNYAVRMGRRPIYVDLDVGQGAISCPSTMGALLVERPATIEDGFSQKAPLIYSFGHTSPGGNDKLYRILVTKLATVTRDRLEANKRAKASGIIINTCGWVKGQGYKHLLHTAAAFRATTILVLDQERLYNELLRDVPRNTAKVVFLHKSGGVVERSKKARHEARDLRIKEYFYGVRSPLYPRTVELKWPDVHIYKIGAPALPDSCMPLGMKTTNNETKLVQVVPGQQLMHHLLAVSFAKLGDEKNVIDRNVAGFVCVTAVDTEKQTITLLSPQAGPLPNDLLIFTEVQFMDSH